MFSRSSTMKTNPVEMRIFSSFINCYCDKLKNQPIVTPLFHPSANLLRWTVMDLRKQTIAYKDISMKMLNFNVVEMYFIDFFPSLHFKSPLNPNGKTYACQYDFTPISKYIVHSEICCSSQLATPTKYSLSSVDDRY